MPRRDMRPRRSDGKHRLDRRKQPSARIRIPDRLRRAAPASSQNHDCRNHDY
ncbi:hypothetical protein [Streptomyces sp. YIM S03343]